MRTNIVIDEAKMKKAMRTGHFKTKKATVSAALDLLIRFHEQAQIRAYRGKLKWEGES